MNISSNWQLRHEEQQKFIRVLTDNLAPLRAKVGITQGDLAYLVGVSRQTYSAIENNKKTMSWNTYLSLILFFDYNQATHNMIRNISAFPDELIERFNGGRVFSKNNLFLSDEKQAKEIASMIQKLDAQGIHALKSILTLEYNRCTGAPGESL